MPFVAVALSLARGLRRDASVTARQRSMDQTQSVVFLLLGALLGVAYSLGTEKYMRAMRHPHIFVRNSMLWLSAMAWLVAAAAVAWLASRIYNQSGGGLEGFDRSLGVLIPFVVRADLIVDWAKRVAWALLNMSTWTQSTVQIHRLLHRAPRMQQLVSVNPDVSSIISPTMARQAHLVHSENHLWTQDAHSLVHISELIHHFEKLGRVAVYAVAVLFAALPAALAWILYSLYQIFVSMRSSTKALALLYFVSIVLTPVCAVVLIISALFLLGGVVSLSVVGIIVQFSVYWSTRIVYYMVRVLLSQAWAGFPKLRYLHMGHKADHDLTNGPMAVRGARSPEEAGIAMAQMGSLLPTELEFTLSSWDGTDKRRGDTLKPISASISRHVRSLSFIGNLLEQSYSNTPSSGINNSASTSNSDRERGGKDSHLNVNTSGNRDAPQARSVKFPERIHPTPSEQDTDRASDGNHTLENNSRILIFMRRLGLDFSVRSGRRRRLSTFYAFAMLVQLQVDSGGNAWRLHSIENLSDSEYSNRISDLKCTIADEAYAAVEELVSRLRGSSKYRLIPTGFPNSRIVPVEDWLRTTLLNFLETGTDADDDDCKAPGVSTLSLED